MRSLEFATDLLVQQGQTHVVEHADRFVQTTPAEPNFWFGNRLVFKSAPEDSAALIAQFHADIPNVQHICISWDIPNLDLTQVASVFEGAGLTVENADCLTLDGALVRREPPNCVQLRAFATDNDWRQSERITRHHHLEDGLPETGLDVYLVGRSKARQELVEAGLGQWFGAFQGDMLLGDMGIFHNDTLIRYQSVQTHHEHRRRGICSALLCTSLDWAKARAPQAKPVIVAQADGDAGRLYRRAGFELAETIVSAYRPPLED